MVDVHLFVVDADAVLVLEVDAVHVEQELEDAVAPRVGPCHRTEDADALHATDEEVHEPERDARLAGVSLG